MSIENVDGRVVVGVAAEPEISSKKIFWITWLGWMLDSFDLGIYIFILVPAMTELLTLEGLPVSPANIARYGGYLFSVFMLGWACSMFWGWLADRIGRVKVMCITILVYSVFTAACGLAAGLMSFAVFRFMAGFGVGGEWAAGTPLLQETVTEKERVKFAGWLHTATPVGFLIGSIASFLLPFIGWRGMFMLGVLPALLTVLIRSTVKEPAKWRIAAAKPERAKIRELFAGNLSRNTWTSGIMMSCIILGVWSSTFWAPTLVSTKLTQSGMLPAEAQKIASWAGIITNIGTLAACLAMPYIATWFRLRRRAALFFFLASFAVNIVAYLGAVQWMNNVTLFIWLLPILGFFTNGVFALYTIWLPEMFPTLHRGLGSGFAFSFGRVLGAAGPSIVGMLVAYTGSFPYAIAIVSLIYLLGIPSILMAPETGDRPLPA